MILLLRAVGTWNAPALIVVPDGAVVIAGVWQLAQPIWLNRDSPARTSGVSGPRDGAFVDRMKSANAMMSSPSSSGSATGSYRPRSRPFDALSSGMSGLVMPISLRYASAANDCRLACWLFHPKRPTRELSPARGREP